MGVPSVVGSAGSSGNLTTSATATIPTYAANDIIYVTGVNGGATANLSCADNAAQGAYTIRAQLTIGTGRSNTWWRRATGSGTGHIVTVSGATNSCACSVTVFRGGKSSGDPFIQAETAVAVTSARSGIAAGITLANGEYDIRLIGVVNSTDNIDTTAFSTPVGAHTQAGGGTSAGGNDTQSECWTRSEVDVFNNVTGTTGDVSFTNAAAAGINHGVHLTGIAGNSAEQLHFRGRDDTETLNSSTFTRALDTNWTQPSDTTFRVRFEVEEDYGGISTGDINPVADGAHDTAALVYSHNGGAWALVNSSSTAIRSAASAQYTHGNATTDVISGSGTTFVTGSGVENNASGSGAHSLLNAHTEIEYALTINSAQVTNGDTFQLRLEACVGRTTQLPTITVGAGTPAEIIPEINMAPMR